MTDPIFYHAVIIGPQPPGRLHRFGVESVNGRVYPFLELKRVAPALAGLPMYFRHDGTITNGSGRVKIGPYGRIGRVVRSWYAGQRGGVHGVIMVDHDEWCDRDLVGHGLSWDVDATTRPIKNSMRWIASINRLISVDFVQFPATGGRVMERVTRAEAMAETAVSGP